MAAPSICSQAGQELDLGWYLAAVHELLLVALATLLTPVLIARSARKLTALERHRLVRHYMDIGPLAVRRLGEGELVDAAMDAVDRSVRFRTGFIGPAICAVATPVLVLISIMLFIDPLSAGVLLIPTVLVPPIVLGFQKLFRGSSGEYRRAQGILSATFIDALRSLNMLKLNGGATWMGQRIGVASEKVRVQVMKLLARNQLVLLVIDASFAVLLLATAALLAWWRVRCPGNHRWRGSLADSAQLPDAGPGQLRGQLLLHRDDRPCGGRKNPVRHGNPVAPLLG